MSRVYFILLLAFCTNCAKTSLVGSYINQCTLYGSPESVVTLNRDDTFSCVFPYIKGEHLEGTWTVKGDTLSLLSLYVVRKEYRDTVKPEHEFARFPKLIIKGKKLYEVSDDEKRKRCYYVRKK